MRNMADIQEEIVQVEMKIGSLQEEQRLAYQELEEFQEQLKEGCSHPTEFRKRHFIHRTDPMGSDTEFETCNICGHRFEKEDPIIGSRKKIRSQLRSPDQQK